MNLTSSAIRCTNVDWKVEQIKKNSCFWEADSVDQHRSRALSQATNSISLCHGFSRSACAACGLGNTFGHSATQPKDSGGSYMSQ